jgi:hypothetical protein
VVCDCDVLLTGRSPTVSVVAIRAKEFHRYDYIDPSVVPMAEDLALRHSKNVCSSSRLDLCQGFTMAALNNERRARVTAVEVAALDTPVFYSGTIKCAVTPCRGCLWPGLTILRWH